MKSEEGVLEKCLDEGSPNQLMRSASLVSLAVMQRLEGAALPRGDLEGALTQLIDLVQADSLEVWRLERIGHFLGLPRWQDHEGTSRKRQREILLGVPPEGVPGQLMKLFSFIWHRKHVGIADLVLGTRTEVELGHLVGLLYPADLVDKLLDGEGIALARTFVEKTCGADHPSLHLLDQLAALKR